MQPTPDKPQAVSAVAISPSPDTHFSSYRESLLEHLFTGEIMSYLWLRGYARLEVLKPQVDNSGYDLVMEANGVVRHIQLKTSSIGSATARVNTHHALSTKPSGCVIWIKFNPVTLELGPFLWLGGAPRERFVNIKDFKIAKHAKANAKGFKSVRPNLRVVSGKKFSALPSIAEVVSHLFGPQPFADDLADVEVDFVVETALSTDL